MGILDRGWWEQPHIDLWTIPHVLAGVIGAALALRFDVGAVAGAAWGVLFASAWELLEHLSGISKVEKITNIVTDVVVMLVGYVVGYWMFFQLQGTRGFAVVFWIACGVFVAGDALGYVAYRRYRKSHKT